MYVFIYITYICTCIHIIICISHLIGPEAKDAAREVEHAAREHARAMLVIHDSVVHIDIPTVHNIL